MHCFLFCQVFPLTVACALHCFIPSHNASKQTEGPGNYVGLADATPGNNYRWRAPPRGAVSERHEMKVRSSVAGMTKLFQPIRGSELDLAHTTHVLTEKDKTSQNE